MRATPSFRRFAYLRYRGQGHEIRVDLPAFPIAEAYVGRLVQGFEEAYLAKYGYRQSGAKVEAVDWYLVAAIAATAPAGTRAGNWRGGEGGRAFSGTRQAYFPELGGYAECPVFERGALALGATVDGPAIIEEAEATTLLLPRQRALVTERGHLAITVEA